MSMDDPVREDPPAFLEHLGVVMADWDEDYARFETPLEPHLLNRSGIPHGGVHATLLDAAMGFAGCWTGDRDAPRHALTLSLNVQYLGAAKGDRLVVEGRRTGGGRSTFFAEAKVTDGEGNVVAAGTGVFRYRRSR